MQTSPASANPAPDRLAERFGTDGLRHLVYVSKALAVRPPDMLTTILRVARRNNRAAGITGLLVYFDGRFLQYLEGPSLAVHGTLSLIRADRRHHNLEVLLDECTSRRLFRAWDMGCLDVGSEGWRRLVQADWPTIRPLGKNGVSGLQVLRELAEHPGVETQAPAVESDRIKMLGGSQREENAAMHGTMAVRRLTRVQVGVAVTTGAILAGWLGWSFLGHGASDTSAVGGRPRLESSQPMAPEKPS